MRIAVRLIAYSVTTICVILLIPFWVPLLIVNFAESPKRTYHLIFDSDNWIPFEGRNHNVD